MKRVTKERKTKAKFPTKNEILAKNFSKIIANLADTNLKLQRFIDYFDTYAEMALEEHYKTVKLMKEQNNISQKILNHLKPLKPEKPEW